MTIATYTDLQAAIGSWLDHVSSHQQSGKARRGESDGKPTF